jgi:hypothetical protein
LRNIILFTTVLFSILFIHAHADTPPARSINSQTYDGSGVHAITATSSGGKEGLDVNVINSGGTSTVNQGTPNGGGINSWWVQGSLGRSWSLLNSTDSVQSWLFDSTGLPLTSVGGSLNANVTNFPSAFGRTWTLNSLTDSVTISGSISATNSANGNTGSPVPTQATQAGGKDGSGNLRALSVDTSGDLNTNVLNFPSVFGVTQSTSPWVVSGTVAATQSGAWSTGRTWSLLNTTDSVNAVQSGAWSTGRTWSLLNTTDSVNVGNFPTTFGVTQSTSPWVVSGTVTSNIGTTNGLALDATLSAPQGSVSGGTVGTKSELAGGQYNTSAPTLTNGQQAALQLDSSGNLKTSGSTTIGGTVAVTQSTSPWVVGQSSGANLHANIDNFPSIQPVSQSGTWTVGRTWSLLNTTDSVNSVQSGTWTTGRTWSLLNTTDSVNAVQSGTWNVGLNTGTNTIGSVKLTDGTNTAAVSASNALKVDGSAVTQPVSAAALPLPTGAATSANQTTAINNQTNGTQKTQVVDGTGAVQGPAQTISGTNYMPVVLTASATPGSAVVARSIQVAGSDGTNARTLSTDSSGNLNVNTTGSNGRTSVALVRNDYSVTNVTTAAYTQLIASTTNTINYLYIFDSSGQTLYIATGGAGSEVNQAYIVPGGNGILNLSIASGTRVSVKAVSANATAGELNITFLK